MFESILSWLNELPNFLHELIQSIGLLSRKKAKIVFLGLDNAGKTTLLHVLKDGRVSASPPTLHPHPEELIMYGICFRTFDLGGHETARRLWKEYYLSVDGIVFLVDAVDRTRFNEAREELSKLLEDPGLADVPIAVLGNKIDIPTAASEDELRYQLGLLHDVTSGKVIAECNKGIRAIELFMVSVVKRSGYADAFEWLAQLI
eukprot:TRINITY_DN47888_c0_g1_i1.p1 TRINITY_DN47888_c0_g1~~TRINITY_DN47888_c0_g1_i1.p1  ORF type:complete len:203 (-),score=38.78 TRINITY_DN47888_c0_g1_i1:104-712(-)